MRKLGFQPDLPTFFKSLNSITGHFLECKFKEEYKVKVRGSPEMSSGTTLEVRGAWKTIPRNTHSKIRTFKFSRS